MIEFLKDILQIEGFLSLVVKTCRAFGNRIEQTSFCARLEGILELVLCYADDGMCLWFH